jgi:hypothetical protein
MAIMVKDLLHYPRADQSIFDFPCLVREALDSKVVLVSLLLV